MPPVTVPTYDQAYGQLGSVYDPQTTQVNTEMSQLQPQEDATLASLDQAKVNAFRDITQGANAKGVMFSGVPIDQQAQYVGTKYLPAVANTKTSFQNSRNTLLDKINQINAQRATQAQGIVSDAQKNAADSYYKQQQLGLSYARLSASRAGSAKAPTQAQINSAVNQHIQGQFTQLRGKDGKVSNETWANALNDYLSAGGKAQDFWSNYGGYVNRKYANKYAGYQNGFGQKFTT